MALASYLKRRGGTYSVRVHVPKDLVEKVGKREIVKALGVSDPTQAKVQGRVQYQEIMTWLERQRTGARLTSEMIERECQDLARRTLDFLRTEGLLRRNASAGPISDGGGDPWEEHLADRLGDWGDAYLQGDLSGVRDEVSGLVAALGVTAEPGSPEHTELCRALLRTRAETYRVARERYGGNPATITLPLNPEAAHDPFVPPKPARVYASSRTATQGEGWQLSAASDAFLAAMGKTDAWTEKTASQVGASLRMFLDFAGDVSLDAVDRSLAAEFKAVISDLPSTHGKRKGDRELPIRAAAEKALGAGVAGLAQKTVKRHMSAVIGLFDWAKEEGRFRGDNPAKGFRYPRSRRPRDERPAWTAEQLKTLFGSPIWTGSRSGLKRDRHLPGGTIHRDHLYFLPLLGAYAGLRLEEACQLQPGDVATEDAIPFLSIAPGDGKQLKSRAAVRRVPLHPVLIEVGFLEQVEEAKREGRATVFAKLRRGGRDQRLGFYVTKEFTNYRKAIGIYREGLDFHALRHTFTTALDEAGVQRQTTDELTGHEGTGETSRYSKGVSLRRLYEAVCKVDYGFHPPQGSEE